jgi:hypothetical protein
MTPGQLVKAVSIALDVPEETVVQHDRNLAVAGLRTTGARGRNAPHVTHLDAARLLLATLGSVRTKDSVETIKAFESVILSLGPSDRITNLGMAKLPRRHNFIEALASLIGEASGPLSADRAEHLLKQMGNMEICMSVPKTGAWILRAEGERPGEQINYYFGPSYLDRPGPLSEEDKKYAKYGRPMLSSGIKQSRSMSGNVILMLGHAFRENDLTSPRHALGALVDLAEGKTATSNKTKKFG